MEEKKKNIDDLFRAGLNDYQEAPRSGMWDRIEGNLDKIDTTKGPGNKKPGGRGGFMGYAIGLLILAAASFFLYNRLSNNNKPSITETNKVQNNTITENKNNSPATGSLTNDKTVATTSENKETKSTGKTTRTNNTAVNHIVAAHVASKHSYTASRPHTTHTLAHHSNHVHTAIVHNNTVADHTQTQNDVVADKGNQSANTATAVENNNTLQPSVPTKETEKIAVAHHKTRHTNHKTLQQPNKNSENDVAATAANSQPATVKNAKPKPVHKQSELAEAKKDSANTVNQYAAKEIADKSIPPRKTLVKYNADIATAAQGPTQPQAIKKKHTATVKKAQIKMPADNAVTGNELATTPIRKNDENPIAEKKMIPAAKKTPKPAQVEPKSANEKGIAKTEPLKQVTKEESTPTPKATAAQSDSDIHPATGNSGSSGSNADMPKTLSGRFNFQAGVKLGYEQGFSQYTTRKFLGAVYAEVGLSDKFSLMLQPTVTYSKLNQDISYGSSSYYQNTGKHRDSAARGAGGTLWAYQYYGTYDSIIAARSIQNQNNIGFQIPFLLKYKVSRSLAILGGVNIDLANLFVINDNITKYHLVTQTDSQATKKPSDFDPFFDTLTYRHPGTPFSSYTPSGTTGINSSVRLGYMLGVDYSLADKFTLEFLISQSLSGYNNITDKNLKSVYSQPYFRLSIGYRFLSIKKKSIPYNGGL